LTVIGVVASLLYTFHYAYSSTQSSRRFAVQSVRYEGVKHLDLPTLDTMVRRTLPNNLLCVDLNRVREIVESEAWVKRAVVRRKLSNQLVVSIQERQWEALAAIDDGVYLVDGEGVVLDRHGARYESVDSPIVLGLKNIARENAREDNLARMRLYLRVVEALARSERPRLQTLSEISVEDPQRVALIPAEDPVPIYVGTEKFLERYETFLSHRDLYAQLKQQYGAIEYVDLTTEGRMVFHTSQTQTRPLAERF
jgi:cell division septal protein FtsQ